MSSYDLAEIWVKCTDKFKESANEKIFDVWIKPIIPLEVTDTYYKVAVKNSFFKICLFSEKGIRRCLFTIIAINDAVFYRYPYFQVHE